MRVSYSCQPGLHEAYYDQQAGGGLPVFAGTRFQKGHGFGNILGGLLRVAMPLVARGSRALGKEVVKAGVGVLGNVLEGKSGRLAAQHHLKAAAKRTLKRAAAEVVGKTIKSPRIETKRIRSLASTKRVRNSQQKRARPTPKDIFA